MTAAIVTYGTFGLVSPSLDGFVLAIEWRNALIALPLESDTLFRRDA